MLSSLLNGSLNGQMFSLYLLRVPCILLALTVHEISHGFMAYKLGDPTARSLGRLSLNPLKHLDLIGTLCMLFLGIGWAKPVPINTRYFKKPRRDMALTGAAGPLSNIGLGIIGLFFAMLVYSLAPDTIFWVTFSQFWFVFYNLNFGLAIFNLIPIPPFDGSRIFFAFLPPKAYFAVMKYERYIMIGILIGLWTGIITLPISGIVNGLEWIFSKLFSLLPFMKEWTF